MELLLKNENSWDKLTIPDGLEIEVGTPVFYGERKMLVDGKETRIAEQTYSGEFALDSGKIITVLDGVITEIIDNPNAKGMMKKAAKEREKEYYK